jgi:hypothetical protein
VKRGAPPKEPGGLTAVLYVRVAPDLLRALDARARHAQEAAGHPVSRADVARDLLREGLAVGQFGRLGLRPDRATIRCQEEVPRADDAED